MHTNDVLVPQGSTSEEVPESGTGARPEPTSSLLRSAKQARQGAQSLAKRAPLPGYPPHWAPEPRAPFKNRTEQCTDQTRQKQLAHAALEKEVAALKLEIAQKEEQLSQQRRQENGQATGARGGKGKAPLDLDLVSGELGQEDWTINERGEVRFPPPFPLPLESSQPIDRRRRS